MSESRTVCPFCARQPGDIHSSSCPRGSSFPGPSEAQRELEKLYASQERDGARNRHQMLMDWFPRVR